MGENIERGYVSKLLQSFGYLCEALHVWTIRTLDICRVYSQDFHAFGAFIYIPSRHFQQVSDINEWTLRQARYIRSGYANHLL